MAPRLLFVFLTLSVAVLRAQIPQTPTITANARLVVLDTVVTDKNGKPVNDLTEKDFQVFEDGKLQRIRSVEPPSLHVLPPSSASATTVFDPAKPVTFGQSPVDILVLDQLNTHFADSSFARRSVQDFLASQPALLREPTTLLSVYDGHFKLLQAFTRDRDALLRALAAAPTEYAWKLEINGKTDTGPLERLDLSLRALEEMAQNYGRIPGRKNLIWVGGGFPSQDPAALDASDFQEIQDTIHHVTNVLLDARVVLYAVDPTSTLPGMTEITDATQMGFMMAGADSVAGGVDPFGSTDDFDRLGPVTGGRVIRGMNDVAQQIASAVDLGTDFYTISYTPSSISDNAAKYRHIQVVCLRPGLTIAARNGYYTGATAPKQLLADASYDLTTAAESGLPLNGLQVAVAPDAQGKYLVKVAAPNLTWKPTADGGATASVYVMAVSLNAKSKMLGHTLLGMTANAKPGANLADPSHTADFLFTAQPAPKAATLRFIVRDSATGRMGSFDLSLSHYSGCPTLTKLGWVGPRQIWVPHVSILRRGHRLRKQTTVLLSQPNPPNSTTVF
jgi:VWFA-related protein